MSKAAQSCAVSMAEMVKGFVVDGPASGVGKTPVTLALMVVFRRAAVEPLVTVGRIDVKHKQRGITYESEH